MSKMLQTAKFYLLTISNISGKVQYSSNNIGINFVEPVTIIPFTTDEVCIKSSYNLKVRLAQQLPTAEWKLAVKFPSFRSEIQQNSHTTVQPRSVVVSGEILKRLHSIILYNATNSRLKMKMRSEFSVHFDTLRPRRTSEMRTTTTVSCVAELFPNVDEQGNISYTDKNSTVSNLKTLVRAGSAPGAVRTLICNYSTQLSSFNVWVEGAEYDLGCTSHADVMIGQKRLLETGLSADVTILTKDGSEIPSHKTTLIGQSSVLEKMLTSDAFVESKSKEIKMEDWSKPEVLAFLAFLFYADLEKALTDTDLAVTLHEMAHCYDVKGLQNGIKPVLLSRAAESFGVDTALELFTIACQSKEIDLKRKAADVLETRRNEELFESRLFKGLSAEVLKELFALSRPML